VGETPPFPVRETHTETPHSPVGVSHTTVPVGVSHTTSISRRGVATGHTRKAPAPAAADGRPDPTQPTLRLAHDADRPTLQAGDGLRLPFPNPAKG
jgi:hypothetical protein